MHIHVYVYKYMLNIIKHNDGFNERTNTLLYKKYISHTLFSKGWCWLCVRAELETGTDCYIDPKFFFDHSSTSSSSWLGLLNHGSQKAQSPLSAAGSLFGILSPTDSNRPGHLVILLFNVHLLPLFSRLFTQVHLLINGSVESQYITTALIRAPVLSSHKCLYQGNFWETPLSEFSDAYYCTPFRHRGP